MAGGILLAACVAGCMPQPGAYGSPAVGRTGLARRPMSLTTNLPADPCPAPALTEADRAELFRQFDEWQKTGGTAPARPVADARGGCGVAR